VCIESFPHDQVTSTFKSQLVQVTGRVNSPFKVKSQNLLSPH